MNLDVRSWTAFLFLGLFMNDLSMLLFFHVLKYLPVTVASTSLYLIPVFGVLLAVALLEERMTLPMLFGSGIVLLATVLIMYFDPQGESQIQ